MSRAKRFLPRWSLYGSVILRDLTLRSAGSFGSFHLLRLLFDEFMIYTVEQIADKVRHKHSLCMLSLTHSLTNSLAQGIEVLRASSQPKWAEQCEEEEEGGEMDVGDGEGEGGEEGYGGNEDEED